MGKVVYSHRQKIASGRGGDFAGRNPSNSSQNACNTRSEPMLMLKFERGLSSLGDRLVSNAKSD